MEVWPYILPLPVDERRRIEFLLSVLGSQVSVDILRLIGSQGRAYQKKIIAELPYSNKTVIGVLKRLVSLGVLHEGMEKKVEGRVRWVKWYEPTDIGRWIIYLVTPPENIGREEVLDIVRNLVKLYMDSLDRFCRAYGVERSFIRDVVSKYVDRLDEP